MTLRRFPQDFLVHERFASAAVEGLVPQWSTSHTHAWLELTKNSVTTPDAAAACARRLHLKPGSAQWAGLKDKHAVTTQTISLHVPTLAHAAQLPSAQHHPPMHTNPALTADALPAQGQLVTRLLGFHARSVRSDDIEHNEFAITIRALTRKAGDTLLDRARLLTPPDDPSGLLVPNYVGDQRFGWQREGMLTAVVMLRGDVLEALRRIIATPRRKDTSRDKARARICQLHWPNWTSLQQALEAGGHHNCPTHAVVSALAKGAAPIDAFATLPFLDQQMIIESYQSHLWNQTLARLLRSAPSGWFEPAATSTQAFIPAHDLTPWRTLALPMPAPALDATHTQPTNAWYASALTHVLASEGFALADLHIPGLRRPSFDCFLRPCVAHARRVDISPLFPDDSASPTSPARHAVTARFALPRGAYATTLLRALGAA